MAGTTLKEALFDINPDALERYRKALKDAGISRLWDSVIDPLNEEIDRTSGGRAISSGKRTDWDAWILSIHAKLLESLQVQDFVMNAREGSPIGPWREIPASAWPTLKIDDLDHGTLSGPGLILFDVRIATTLKSKRGRKQAADWSAYEERLRDKISTDGAPDMNNVSGWQKQADVERFIRELVEHDGCTAEVSTVRSHVKKMLDRIMVRN